MASEIAVDWSRHAVERFIMGPLCARRPRPLRSTLSMINDVRQGDTRTSRTERRWTTRPHAHIHAAAKLTKTARWSSGIARTLVSINELSGGLAHRETGRFPGGPLVQEFFRAPSRTRELISLIISWHSRQIGSASSTRVTTCAVWVHAEWANDGDVFYSVFTCRLRSTRIKTISNK